MIRNSPKDQSSSRPVSASTSGQSSQFQNANASARKIARMNSRASSITQSHICTSPALNCRPLTTMPEGSAAVAPVMVTEKPSGVAPSVAPSVAAGAAVGTGGAPRVIDVSAVRRPTIKFSAVNSFCGSISRVSPGSSRKVSHKASTLTPTRTIK